MKQTTKRLIELLVLLAVVASLTGCIRQKQYRFVNIPATGGLPAIEDHTGDGYKVAFIEVKDNGKLFDEQQRVKAKELIDSERKGIDTEWVESSVVVIFIHGWKNNADEGTLEKPKNVGRFKELLKEIAARLPEKEGRKTPLVGIYIGWHGKSLALPGILSWVSFWPRGIAAKHVGEDELRKTLNILVDASTAGRATAGVNPRTVIIGHSFGSRVLEEAQVQEDEKGGKTGIQIGDCKSLQEGNPITQRADLILFVNAATGSKVTREIIEKCTPKETSKPDHVFPRHRGYTDALCKTDEGPGAKNVVCRPYPMFVSISSRSDYATKFLLPIAAFRLSAAHTRSLNTHRVIELKPNDPVPDDNVFTFQAEDKEKKQIRYYATVPKDKNSISPFWIMTVDKHIIANHSDIWNPNFRQMLFHLMGEVQIVPMNKESTYEHLTGNPKASVIKK